MNNAYKRAHLAYLRSVHLKTGMCEQQSKENSANNRHYKTYNVKFHFKLSDKNLAQKIVLDERANENQQSQTRHKNFCIKRIEKNVFTIFSSGHVNVTGVRSFDDVRKTIDIFTSQFNTVEKNSIVIDNSTTVASYFGTKSKEKNSAQHSEKRINISALTSIIKNDLSNEDNITLSLRPHFFPGAVIRRKNKCTIIVFTTGRFIIIGAKSTDEVIEAYDTVCAIIRRV